MNNINPISTPPFAYAGEVSLNKEIYKTKDISPIVSNVSENTQQITEPVSAMNVLPPVISKKLSQPMYSPDANSAQESQQQNISQMDNIVVNNNPTSKLFGEGGKLNAINVGGTHEQNPLGGVPMGKSNDGVSNFVEQDETSFNFKGQKFIFSNRIFI